MNEKLQILENDTPCIERDCQRCEGTYLVTLAEASRVPPDAVVNLCPGCMTAVFLDGAAYQALDEAFAA